MSKAEIFNNAGSPVGQYKMQTRYKMPTDTKTISVKYTINFQYFKPTPVSRNRLSLIENYLGCPKLFFYVWRREITLQSRALFRS